MTHRSLSTPNSGLRVFSASLLSALLIMMPFVQMAAAEKRSEFTGQRSESGISPTPREDSNAAAENVFLNAPIPKPAPEPPALLPTIVATKDDGLAAATTVAPGGTITYTVNINNNGTLPADDATNVQFSDTIDAHTTLVAGSPVAAVSDKYNAIGNTQISVPDGPTDLLGNDFDPPGDNTGMTVTAYGATTGTEQTSMGTATATAQGGSVTVQSNGSFTYDPPLGFEGTDTFKYRAADSGGFTAITTVKITIAGIIWFINNNAGACTSSCDGRFSHPFQTLAAFQAVNNGAGSNPAAGDKIFLYESATAYVGPVTLLNTQRLIGQDATASLATISGLTAPSGTDPFPAMNTGAPSVTITGSNANGINLGIDNILRGFTVGNTGTGTKINGISFGTLIVGNSGSPDVTLNGTGQALNLSTGVLSVTGGFVSVATTSSAGAGISLAGVADSDGAGGLSFNFGSTTVSGSTTQGILVGTTTADLNFGTTAVGTASAGSGGTDAVSLSSNSSGTRTFGALTIQNSTGNGFRHASGGGAVNVTGATAITNPGTIGINVDASTTLVSFGNANVTQSGGTGVSFTNNANVNGDLTFADLDISPDANQAALVATTNAGTLTSTTGDIITTDANAINSTSSVLALALNSVTAANSGSAASGISLTSTTGTLSSSAGTITGGTTPAVLVSAGSVQVTYGGGITQADNAALLSVSNVNTSAINFNGSLSATNGTGLQFDNADGIYNFNSTTTLNGGGVGDTGIDILNGSAGTFSFGGTTIINPTGVALNVSASSGAISISGAISKTSGGRLIDFDNYDTGTATISGTLTCNTSCDGIEVTNNGASSGTVNFSGATKTLNTGADNAVQLDNNDGGQINFTGGGLDIDTTSGIGFNAINGGSVNVTTGANNNTIDTDTGKAVDISAGTNIGGSGVTFRAITVDNGASNSATNAILLNGTTGAFTVSGDGSQTSGLYDRDGSGGTINRTTGHSVSLTNASNVTLRQMNMTNTQGSGAGCPGACTSNFVNSSGGSNIVLSAVLFQNPSGHGWYGLNIGGTNSFDNNGRVENWQTFNAFGVYIDNTSTNLTSFTVSNNVFTTSATGAAGFVFDGNGATTGTVNVISNEFTLIDQNAFQINNDGSGNITAVVQKNNCHDSDATSGDGNNTMFLALSGSGDLNFTIGGPNAADGNTFTNTSRLQALAGIIQVNAAGGSTTIGKLNGSIQNNTITNPGIVGGATRRGIMVAVEASAGNHGAHNVLIANNSVQGLTIQGIIVSVTSLNGFDILNTNWTIKNNQVGNLSPVGSGGGDGGSAIEFEPNIAVSNTDTHFSMNLLVENNTAVANNNSAAGTTLEIINRATGGNNTSTLNATVRGNQLTQSNGAGEVFEFLNSSGTLTTCLDLNSPNTSPNNAIGGTGGFRLTNNAGTFNIEGMGASTPSAFLGPRNQSNGVSPATITAGGTVGTFGSSAGCADSTAMFSMPQVQPREFVASNIATDNNRAQLVSETRNEPTQSFFLKIATALTISASEAGSRIAPTALAHSAEVRAQRSEVRDQRSEIRDQRSEVSTHHAPSEVRSQTSDVRRQTSEVENRESGLRAHYATLSKLATRATAPVVSDVDVNIGTLPAGGSVTITFQVTVNNPPNLTLLNAPGPRVENQGTVTFTETGSPVLTDDPNVGGAADKTATRIDLFDLTNSLACTPDPSGNGQQVTCIATLTENPAQAVDPNSTVDFIDTSNANAVICNDVAISGPAGGPYTAQCQTSALTVGTHNLRADYSGDGNFDASQSNLYAQDVLSCVTNPIVTTNADAGAGSLRQAIADACDGSTIDFNITGAGPHVIALVTGSGALTISKNLTINNTSGESITVNGAAGIRVFAVASGKTVAISNLTIANGAPTGGFPASVGGGIFNEGSLTLTNSTVTNSSAAAFGGGGIYNNGAGATLNLTSSTVSNNDALGSGGGGGIYNNGGTVTLLNSTVSGNDANGDGGGVNNNSGTLNVTNSTISGNNALLNASGGGLVNFGTLNVTNSTISGNNANNEGGGIFNNHSAGTVTLTSVTVTNNRADADNTAAGTGGGIFVFNTSLQPLLQNTIVAGNFNEDGASDAADDIAGTVNSTSSFNLIGTGGAGGLTTTGAPTHNQVGVASPGLGSLINNGGPTQTHALLTGSPAIDKGDDFSLVPTTDQRGQTRPLDTPSVVDTSDGSDIGAFEKGFSPIPAVTTTAGNLSYAENDPATAIDPGLTVTDDDSANLVDASASITTNFQSGQDVLSWIDNNAGDNITLSGTSTAQTIVLTGTDTLANYEAALRAVTYQNTSDNPSTLTRTVTFTVNDGTNAGSGTRNIAVSASNDSPAITSDGGGPTASVNAAENQTAVTTVTSTDPDGGTPGYSIIGGADMGAFSIGSSSGVLTFNSAPDFETPTDAGANNVYEVTVQVSDGNAGTDTQAISVTVTNINDAPAITSDGGGPTANVNAAENQTAVTTVTSNDVDGGTPSYSITGGADMGAFSIGSGSGVLTFNSAPDFETPTDAGANNVYEVTVQVSDGNSGTDTQAISVTVTNVNEAPVNTVPGTQGTNLDTPLTFASGNANQVSVVDVDAGSNTIQVALSVTNGTLTLSGTTGLNFACGGCSGDGTADASMTFQGSLTNINNALNGMVFTPTSGFTGTAVLSITSNDLGNTGSGGAQSDGPDTVNIGVATNITINDAKIAEPGSGSANLIFTVSLSAPAATVVSVDYNTSDGTAKDGVGEANTDYTLSAGQVVFQPGQQVRTIHVPVLADGDNAEVDETLTVTLSNVTPNATIADGTGAGTITVANPAGTLLISEFRQIGPGPGNDPLDDFVEIYNNTNAPITVPAGGYGLFRVASTCSATDQPQLIGTIPAGTVIPARGHFLFTGPIANYSLKDYGGTNAAVNNALLTVDLGANENFGLFATVDVTQISSVNRFDAVGFGINDQNACDLLREGTLSPALTVSPSLGQHSYFRKMCDWLQGQGCTVPGVPKDTNDNLADFWLADTAGSAITGRLGAPGPENLASPIRRDNAGINVVVLDGTVGSAAAPNRDRNGVDPAGTFGSMKLRYRVTNNTGAPVTRLRYRIVDISTAIQPPGPTADLRALTSSIEASVGPVNDSVTCTAGGAGAPPCTVTVTATTLETPPNQAIGGGYNSTLSSGTITTGSPLPNGQSILINFKLGVEKTGTFRVYVTVEALP